MSPIDDTFLSGSLDKSMRLWDLRSANCQVGDLRCCCTLPSVIMLYKLTLCYFWKYKLSKKIQEIKVFCSNRWSFPELWAYFLVVNLNSFIYIQHWYNLFNDIILIKAEARVIQLNPVVPLTNSISAVSCVVLSHDIIVCVSSTRDWCTCLDALSQPLTPKVSSSPLVSTQNVSSYMTYVHSTRQAIFFNIFPFCYVLLSSKHTWLSISDWCSCSWFTM